MIIKLEYIISFKYWKQSSTYNIIPTNDPEFNNKNKKIFNTLLPPKYYPNNKVQSKSQSKSKINYMNMNRNI